MKRREFLTSFKLDKNPINESKPDPVLELQNKVIPDNLTLGVASIASYTGAWGADQVKHLLRRTLFGFNKSDVDFFASKTMSTSVDYLMAIPNTAPSPPLNGYNTATIKDPNIAAGQTWVNGPDNLLFSNNRKESLYSWWMQQVLQPDRHIREKMVMFWHNHFVTAVENSGSPINSYNYNKLIRANCLGNFKPFVRSIITDSAMLVYLNGEANTKAAPDENLARELMELFTLGKGSDSLFTETDVRAVAKILTGWRINKTTLASYFEPTEHDTSNKTFSSFFNSTVITGKTGASGATEVDDLVNMIFTKEDVIAKFIVRKIYRYFVYYVIDTNIENTIIAPLAADFELDWDINKVVTALLKSQHFYDVSNVGAYIKNPLDVIASCVKNFNIKLPTSPVEDQYKALYTLFVNSHVSGLTLGNPPNVAGWPAYYQAPQFHEIWLNSSSLPARIQYCVLLALIGQVYNGTDKLQADVLAFVEQFPNPENPVSLIQNVTDFLLPVNYSAATKTQLKISALLYGQTADYYWTIAWNDYKSNPNDPTKKGLIVQALQLMLKFILDSAEHQLA